MRCIAHLDWIQDSLMACAETIAMTTIVNATCNAGIPADSIEISGVVEVPEKFFLFLRHRKES